MDELMRVTQLPQIEERLRTMKEQVDRRVADALALACTEETIQSVKAERAKLRREFDALEEQRKAIKNAIMGPYNAFDAVYKECVSDTYRRADDEFRKKIGDTESAIKVRCEAELRGYFDELCEAHHIDWLTYERTGVKVDMASAKQKTPKKLREQIANFVVSVSCDVDTISGLENADEILAEYKKCLSFSEAFGTVSDRHRRIEEEAKFRAEREKIRAAEKENERKVESLAPPTVATGPLKTASFKLDYNDLISVLSWMMCNGYSAPVMQATDTRERLIALREWMKANNYQYK